MAKQAFTLPVGRLVQGNLYDGSTTDSKGKPRVVKSGPNAGQPLTQWYFAVAIDKEAGHTHWGQTDWGQKVLQAGAEGYPALYQRPDFSWKIEDGDSQIPNLNGRKPADNEGWPGHWIVKFSGSAGAPRIFHRDASGHPQPLTVPGAVKLGYYIQVGAECVDNKPSESPGVYMNYAGVLFAGVGPEIYVGPNATEMFGTAATVLPPGAQPATAIPAGMAQVPAVALPAAPGVPAVPAVPVAAPAAAAVVPPTVVQPNGAFLNIPAPGGAPVAAPLPVAAPVPVPSVPVAAAGPTPTSKLIGTGHTVESMLASGWTIDLLRQHQYIV